MMWGVSFPIFFLWQAWFFIRIEQCYEKEILVCSILQKGRLKQRENKRPQSTKHRERSGILRWLQKLDDRLQQPSIKHLQDNSPSQAEASQGEREAPLSQGCLSDICSCIFRRPLPKRLRWRIFPDCRRIITLHPEPGCPEQCGNVSFPAPTLISYKTCSKKKAPVGYLGFEYVWGDSRITEGI